MLHLCCCTDILLNSLRPPGLTWPVEQACQAPLPWSWQRWENDTTAYVEGEWCHLNRRISSFELDGGEGYVKRMKRRVVPQLRGLRHLSPGFTHWIIGNDFWQAIVMCRMTVLLSCNPQGILVRINKWMDTGIGLRSIHSQNLQLNRVANMKQRRRSLPSETIDSRPSTSVATSKVRFPPTGVVLHYHAQHK